MLTHKAQAKMQLAIMKIDTPSQYKCAKAMGSYQVRIGKNTGCHRQKNTNGNATSASIIFAVFFIIVNRS